MLPKSHKSTEVYRRTRFLLGYVKIRTFNSYDNDSNTKNTKDARQPRRTSTTHKTD